MKAIRVFLKLTTAALFTILFIALANASSPPANTFDSARDLGIIDAVGPTTISPDRKFFRCFHRKVTLNIAHPPFETFYFKFTVNSTKSRLFIQMLEEPPTTLWLTTYTAQRAKIKDYITKPHDLINEVFEKGTYFLQVQTRASNPHLPDGTNVARLTFQGLSGDSPSDAPNQADPVNLGTLNDNVVIKRIDALSTVNGRTRTYDDSLENKDCSISAAGELFDDGDNFVFTAAAGLVRPAIIREFDIQNWQMPLELFYLSSFGDWLKVTGQIRHHGGEMKLRVGSANPVDFHTNDGYVAYELNIGRK